MDITKVKLRDPFDKHVEFKVPPEVPYKPIVISAELRKQAEIPKELLELSWYEEARRKFIFIKEAVPNFYLILKGKIMKDWRTTLTGAIGLLATVVGYFGFDFPSEVQVSIVSITVFVIGLFSRDAASAPAPIEKK